MPRWRPATTSSEVIAAAVPHMGIDHAVTALESAQMRRALLGERPVAVPAEGGTYQRIRARVHMRLLQETTYRGEGGEDDTAVRERLAELVNDAIQEQGINLSIDEQVHVVERIGHDLLGLGPLEMLLADPDITEIMVNGPGEIWIERDGRLHLTDMRFDDTDQLMQVIDRIVTRVGRRVDETSPMVDARMADGSRLNVVIPPVALSGPTLTIRRFRDYALGLEEIIANGTATPAMIAFLRAAVRGRLNIMVSGGTGSGKTTTLNLLSGFIPDDERIVTIENAAELKLRQRHVISMETRPTNIEGKGEITIRELVINSLRMRPDRIVVGECRGGEALDMLQAMNTGHDGSLTTIHANSPEDAVSRVETMVLMAGTELPTSAVRAQIGSAIHVIVQQARLRDGRRKIVKVTEVLGYHNGQVQLRDLFVFRQTGVDDDGNVIGAHSACGVLPQCMDDLAAAGQPLDPALFGVGPMNVSGRVVDERGADPAAGTRIDDTGLDAVDRHVDALQKRLMDALAGEVHER